MTSVRSIRIPVAEANGEVSGLFQRPRGARALLLLAHGAGAGMRHPFMEAMSDELAKRGIGTLRYQFPYMEQGRRAPSPRPLLVATVRAASREAMRRARGLPVFAGGKSMGGRMTSLAAAQGDLPAAVSGIVFFGFPLHAVGKSGAERAEHLREVGLPMLFLQGSRDKLAELSRIKPVCRALGRRASLHIVDGADHGFHVLVRSGRSDDEVRFELADAASRFIVEQSP